MEGRKEGREGGKGRVCDGLLTKVSENRELKRRRGRRRRRRGEERRRSEGRERYVQKG